MAHRVRKISPAGKAIPVDDVIGINGYRVHLAHLKQRFAEGGYQLHETPHFLLFTRNIAPTIIIVHWFAPEEIDDAISSYFLNELQPLGVLTKARDMEKLYSAVVGSLAPFDLRSAWKLYGINTVQNYRKLLANVSDPLLSPAPLHSFARLYRRIHELHSGKSLLDVGCAFGFLPLLIAQSLPLVDVVGVDISAEAFTYTPDVAHALLLDNVRFTTANVLAPDFHMLGSFDTVTALHVLEHLTETETPVALTHLLQVAKQRLIIAVPYEQGKPVILHGHKQLFSRSKLEAVGHWCLQQWNMQGSMHYEDCADGLLVLDR